MALTRKQQLFCQEYLIDLNATAAYTRAGFSASPEAARRNASRLLTKADIQDFISTLQRERSQRTEITGDRVIQEIARVAFATVTDVLSFDDQSGVTFKDSSELSDDVKAAIAEISSDVETRTYQRGEGSQETETTVKRKLKMHGKMDALKLLSSYLGLTSDFNMAIATLQKYGLHLRRTEVGWEVLMSDSSSLPQ
jgi:phage terminase small subunit